MPPHGTDGDLDAQLAAHHAHWAAAGPHFFAPLGVLMFLLFAILVIATITFLRRGGQLGPFDPAPWARQAATPEREARSILAERFAHGDISSDEFLERASVLNWTPGVEPLPVPRKRRR